jgi:large subunit ribosomal protein L20
MRVKGGNKHERRNKILKAAKGYFGSKHRLYRTAKEQLLHSWDYAYQHRRTKKREFRALWITRISAAVNQVGLSYSRFMHGLKVANVNINRKMLSELAINDAVAFNELVALAKKNLQVK